MRKLMRNAALALWLGMAAAGAVVGCGGSSSPMKDAGGAGKDGGAAGQGGAGSGGTGGATGGSMGGGGGAAGTGDAGSAGMDAAAGATAADGGNDVGRDVADAAREVVKPDGAQGLTYMFDTSVQGWAFAPIGSTPVGNPSSPNNLAVRSTMAWDSANDAEGSTTSGSLRGTVPFTTDAERIDFQAFTSPTAKYDWTGYTLSAKVRLVSGGRTNPGCPLRAWFYVTAVPNFGKTLSSMVNLSTGTWVTLTYDMADAGVDVAMIQEMGIQVTTGPACTADAGAPDGGTDAAVDAASPTATTAVILIDDVLVSVK